MNPYDADEIQQCYNLTAEAYARSFSDELDGKPFDRETLARFARSVHPDDTVAEFGTATGHIAAFLRLCGLTRIVASDIAQRALQTAAARYPDIRFEYQDMRATTYAPQSIGGLVCFYGIVHFSYDEIAQTFREWKRILKPGGRALFSFHVGDDESVRVEGFLGQGGACASWNFFKVDSILDLMGQEGLAYDEVVVRYPYPKREHPSKRCYIQFVVP